LSSSIGARGPALVGRGPVSLLGPLDSSASLALVGNHLSRVVSSRRVVSLALDGHLGPVLVVVGASVSLKLGPAPAAAPLASAGQHGAGGAGHLLPVGHRSVSLSNKVAVLHEAGLSDITLSASKNFEA